MKRAFLIVIGIAVLIGWGLTPISINKTLYAATSGDKPWPWGTATIRAMSYQPTPPCNDPGNACKPGKAGQDTFGTTQCFFFDSDYWNDDFKKFWGPDGRDDIGQMAKMGVNVIRLYNWNHGRGGYPGVDEGACHMGHSIDCTQRYSDAHKSFLDYCHQKGVYVMIPIDNTVIWDQYHTYWAPLAVPGQGYPDFECPPGGSNPKVDNTIEAIVNSCRKDPCDPSSPIHPAVHSFVIGNEVNFIMSKDDPSGHHFYKGTLPPGENGECNEGAWKCVLNRCKYIANQIWTHTEGKGPNGESYYMSINFNDDCQKPPCFEYDICSVQWALRLKDLLSSEPWYATHFYNSWNPYRAGYETSAILPVYEQQGMASIPLVFLETGLSQAQACLGGGKPCDGKSAQDPACKACIDGTGLDTMLTTLKLQVTNFEKWIQDNPTKTFFKGYTLMEWTDEQYKDGTSATAITESRYGLNKPADTYYDTGMTGHYAGCCDFRKGTHCAGDWGICDATHKYKETYYIYKYTPKGNSSTPDIVDAISEIWKQY